MTILTEIIQILVGGITGIATGIGQGLQTLVTNIFLTGGENTQLSTYGILTVCFAGIALAIGLSRAVIMWVGSLGGKKIR